MLASIFTLSTLLCTLEIAAPPQKLELLTTDRRWAKLPGPNLEKALERAAQLLARRTIILAGARIDGKVLRDIQKRSRGGNLTRAFREHLHIPIDPEDFLLFLDDLLSRSPEVFTGRPIDLTPSRLRSAGILLHPDDAFRKRPRKYGVAGQSLILRSPEVRRDTRPASAGASLGPRWTFRYQQPESQADRLWALYRLNPDFAQRVRSLVKQLRNQGVGVTVESTVRDRRRGFLIYGAYILSRSTLESEVAFKVARLERLQKSWKLDVPIQWAHSGGWKRTIEEARKMAEAFGVTYATENGARKSDHYDGRAIDIYAVGLPRVLRLKAPNGKKRKFDLFAVEQSRDLNLTPELVSWIEDNFEMKKLRQDYPHWRDARR